MVKVRMNTVGVAAEIKCLRRLIGMRCSNVYDLSPKSLARARQERGTINEGERGGREVQQALNHFQIPRSKTLHTSGSSQLIAVLSNAAWTTRYKGDISELELYFVIVNNEYGEQTEEELLPGGKNLRVTNENVITFIHLVANHRLNFQIRQQSSHFLRGFQQLIPKDWIDMFNEHELQLLISGSLDSLDVDDLRMHTNYVGGYHSEHYVIDMFWDVLKSFSLENQKKFLKFVTGCSRGPLLGFKYLEPLFCIQRAGNGAEGALDRLPTAATCMNLLKLPPYRRSNWNQN